jgi:hypothetical protein
MRDIPPLKQNGTAIVILRWLTGAASRPLAAQLLLAGLLQQPA